MYTGFSIEPPFFEIGPKAYLYGEKALDLALHAEEISVRYDVRIILTPQYTDIYPIARATRNLLVFAQHMDSLPVGRGIGSVLPEAVKAAGAGGVLLNHVEKRLSQAQIRDTIRRADEVGLASMVCADTPEDAALLAKFQPNIILAESPLLIGEGKRSSDDQAEIERINHLVWEADERIRVLHGAGIRDAQDVYEVVKCGAQGSGSTSAVVLAENPAQVLEDMIRAMRKAWDEIHPHKENRS